MADVRAVATGHGELDGEFERRLDALLSELSPGWRAPELAEPHRSSESFRDYHRRNTKRMQVAHVLAQRPDTGAAVAGAVLDTIVCDEDVSSNRQLIEPMLKAVGRRRVQQHLIAVVEQGGPLQKVCAVRAWYWSQVTMVYRSVQGLRDREATPESIAADRDVADLRTQYRTACLHTFVDCAHAPTRDWLARGFVLDESFYPPASHPVVERARQIALADPARFADLLAKTSDNTNLAAIHVPQADDAAEP